MTTRQRTKQSDLPWADDMARWARIQRAAQRFVQVIMAETHADGSQEAALDDVRRAIIHAQEAPAPSHVRVPVAQADTPDGVLP